MGISERAERLGVLLTLCEDGSICLSRLPYTLAALGYPSAACEGEPNAVCCYSEATAVHYLSLCERRKRDASLPDRRPRHRKGGILA